MPEAELISMGQVMRLKGTPSATTGVVLTAAIAAEDRRYKNVVALLLAKFA
jgi:hypothetical protein